MKKSNQPNTMQYPATVVHNPYGGHGEAESTVSLNAYLDLATKASNCLREAYELLLSWSEYADDYFKEKHDLQMDLLKVQRFIAGMDDVIAQSYRQKEAWYSEGYSAAYDHLSTPACPYNEGRAREKWMEGWHDALEEMRLDGIEPDF